MEKIFLYINTVKFLKTEQVCYRIYYIARNLLRRLTGYRYKLSIDSNLSNSNSSDSDSIDADLKELVLENTISRSSSYANGTFTFLNLSKKFDGSVDWQYSGHGALWAYNLNYFDYLNQSDITREEGLRLIYGFIEKLPGNKTGLEPYPTSLRIINWIKFLRRNKIKDKKIDASLHAQGMILTDNIEYHLLGNHLLENAFALVFAGYYFGDEFIYQKGKEILVKELPEQVLPDGGHFELSPMYHQIILERILDCINLVQNNEGFRRELNRLLSETAELMLGWLKNMTFRNGDIPLVNDSANGIAATSAELFDYAGKLGIKEKVLPLGESGYRKIERNKYEAVVDVGPIGPDYQPGHSHSDTFSFVLYADGKPFIVDTGVSTYESNERRLSERGTSAHNTVRIENTEQSEVWESFRVGRRASVRKLKEAPDSITAEHTGYMRIGAVHRREFEFHDTKVVISDSIISNRKYLSFAFLHFHPEVNVNVENNMVIADGKQIIITGYENIEMNDFDYAIGFNRLLKAKMVKVSFYKNLTIEILV
ncbi:MAG: alginate lyase family protein [Candidatus Schekmanbacteria bacterium]|nr:alginate lyase family protein [Candidatus Schekmanbacteria bacterium]